MSCNGPAIRRYDAAQLVESPMNRREFLGTVAAAGIQGVLFGVTGRDPLTYGAVAALVAVVSLIATLVPARRATRVDPMIALRAE